ncbi:hypothetical protein AB1K54_14465 [Microbacterium sp. BWT-B31]|uniref:hypothetical protein n=1 Tax=Microbacterium sp. BWT-B31 TaxID=3232072 RepID=UPI003527A440
MTGVRGMHEDDAADLRSLVVRFGIAVAKLEIIERLAQGPATIADLGAACGYTRHGVEPHLDVLESLGLISSAVVRVEGVCRPTRRYALEEHRLDDLRWALHDVLDFTDADARRRSA